MKNPEVKLPENPSAVELIKQKSRFLRGTIAESLADPTTGAIAEADTQLIKFHGSYQQDDRDVRAERDEKKLEPAYSFMIRVRMPGGYLTAAQWVAFDDIAQKQEFQTLKLTTRQAIQFHGVIKFNLKRTMQEINAALLDSIAACGDVNRNVMCSPNPYQSLSHEAALKVAADISDHLLPRTRAYYEIWLDEEKVAGGAEEIEPLYGKQYLPRKFKIAIAIPPYNDTDIFSNDIGLIAIEENGVLVGFNVAIGGGLGATHGDPRTYPRLGNLIGFVTPEQATEACFHIAAIQRDYGNREDRKLSRFKYTIDRLGLDFVKQELNQRLGYALAPLRPYQFLHNGDLYDWVQGTNGKWFKTLYIEHGRVKDSEGYPLKSGLRHLAERGLCDFRLTGNQNLTIGNIAPEDKVEVEALLQAFGIQAHQENLSGIRKFSIACVAFPTCTLAMAEAERYLPDLMTKIEALLEDFGLRDEQISIRMTGCPNGCGRPYLGEIGFVGKALGRYNLHLGADEKGERLNTLYRENIDEATILETLRLVLARYAQERQPNERFGNFVHRIGLV